MSIIRNWYILNNQLCGDVNVGIIDNETAYIFRQFRVVKYDMKTGLVTTDSGNYIVKPENIDGYFITLNKRQEFINYLSKYV